MDSALKIGELAKRTGLTTKTIRYYELLGLLPEPERTHSGYRIYGLDNVERLEFIKKAKRLGLSLDDIKDILTLHQENQRPCVHVLALLGQRIQQIDGLIRDLQTFRRELVRLRDESQKRFQRLPESARICGIIERGIHHKGELALAWLEKQKGKPKVQRSVEAS